MAKDNSDDQKKPLLAKAKAKKSKSLKVSTSSRKIRKETAPTKTFDGIKPPTADDLVDLKKYPRFEFSNTKIYFEDLIEGTGKAVLMKAGARHDRFYKQKVRYEYNCYNRSGDLVKSSDGRRLKYSFCLNRSMGIGLQGMKEGGIRRITILPPHHKSPDRILKSTPPNSEVPDGEIFDLKLLKVRKSKFCNCRLKFPAGKP